MAEPQPGEAMPAKNVNSDGEIALCAAIINRAIEDLSIEEIVTDKTGHKRIHRHWLSAIEFLTGNNMDTWLRAANIDGVLIRKLLKKDRILGDISMGLGSVGLVRVNQAQGFGWLYGR